MCKSRSSIQNRETVAISEPRQNSAWLTSPRDCPLLWLSAFNCSRKFCIGVPNKVTFSLIMWWIYVLAVLRRMIMPCYRAKLDQVPEMLIIVRNFTKNTNNCIEYPVLEREAGWFHAGTVLFGHFELSPNSFGWFWVTIQISISEMFDWDTEFWNPTIDTMGGTMLGRIDALKYLKALLRCWT